MILQSIRATRPAQAEHPPQAPSYQATPGRSLSRLRCQVSERIVHVCCMDIIMTTINLGLRLDCSSSRAFSAWMRAGWRCFLAARGDDILRTVEWRQTIARISLLRLRPATCRRGDDEAEKQSHSKDRSLRSPNCLFPIVTRHNDGDHTIRIRVRF